MIMNLIPLCLQFKKKSFLISFSGGLSNFLYHVSLPDNFDNKNECLQSSKPSVKRPRKDSLNNNHLPEPKEVIRKTHFFV